MKLKLTLLAAILSYGSLSSAFTLYNCDSLDKELNQTLIVSETTSRAPSEDITLSVSKNTDDGPDVIVYEKIYPQGTKTKDTVTTNIFSGHNINLDIVTKTSYIFGAAVEYDADSLWPNCTRVSCDLNQGSINDKLKITTHAVLTINGLATTYLCNDLSLIHI